MADQPQRLRLRTFGGLSLDRAGSPIGGAGQQPRRLAILALLAAAGAGGMTRARLLGLLWPETDEERGRQALSQALYALRRDSGGQSLVKGASEILRLDPAVISSDVGDLLDAASAADHVRMAACYVGTFLDGVYLTGALGFERWVEDTRARFAALAARAFEALATISDAAGDYAAAAGWWQRLTEVDALQTRAVLGLVAALIANGERGAALGYAERFARRVREDTERDANPAVGTVIRQLRSELQMATEMTAIPDAERVGFESRYVLGRELGRGGMAIVFLARDVRHDRDVAVKMLHPDVAEALGRERLAREIRVTAGLRHPHILPLFDSGEIDGTPYFVMPFVEGETLRARLSRDHRMSIDDAARLCREVADALAHAHARGVVHRDIKPENIMISDGHAIICDFGIARLLTDAAQPLLTQVGLSAGTPAYMSPEQFSEDAEVDGHSDVYSLACVMFEMLTGRPPWIAAAGEASRQKRLAETPPLVTALRPDVPSRIATLLARALHPEPTERGVDAIAFAEALTGALPIAAEPSVASLPEPPGVLVGRERELAAARALITRPDLRVLTVTGSGGAGKTRVALRLARDLSTHFGGGVRFVDLSAVREADAVLPAIAASLNAREGEGRSALDAIVQTVATRHMLLLLDNFEQVIAGAPALAPLLSRCPRLSLLVTSRIRLRIRGEHEFFLSPLALPGAGVRAAAVLRESPAVDLFLTVARASNPTFDPDDSALGVIADICTRLDGLPLAIELAASRCRLLSPRAIIARMDRRFDLLVGGARDLPSRQQTLRSAIAWGYDLLSDDERLALRGLSVFAGGAALDDAMAVLDLPDALFLETVQSLVDASLIRRAEDPDGGTRFVLLESIREFCVELSVASGEDRRLQERHLEVFASLATSLPAAIESADSTRALARFDQERENLRAALDYADRAGHEASFARMTLCLWRAWLVRGEWADARRRLARAMQLSTVTGTTIHAELLSADVTIAQNQGECLTAFESAQRALELWRRADDHAGVARTLGVMGWLGWRLGEFAEARRTSEESLALHRRLGDSRGIALALSNLGWIDLSQGNASAAVVSLEESLARRRQLHDARNVAFTLTVLGWARLRNREPALAGVILSEACTMFNELGERQLLAFNVCIRAEREFVLGNGAAAHHLLSSDAIPQFRKIGDRWGLAFALGILTDVLAALGRHDEAHAALAECRTICEAIGDRLGMMHADTRKARRLRLQGDELDVHQQLASRIQAEALAMGVPDPFGADRTLP